MTSLFEIGLTNAALAGLLAIVVWLVTRVWRHPAFVHALWVIVLVKLITPPIVTVPWPSADGAADSTIATIREGQESSRPAASTPESRAVASGGRRSGPGRPAGRGPAFSAKPVIDSARSPCECGQRALRHARATGSDTGPGLVQQVAATPSSSCLASSV